MDERRSPHEVALRRIMKKISVASWRRVGFAAKQMLQVRDSQILRIG